MNVEFNLTLTVARALLENAEELFYVLDREGKLLFGNRAYLGELRDRFGVNVRVGDDVTERVGAHFPEHLPIWRDRLRRALAGQYVCEESEVSWGNEFRHYRAAFYPIFEHGTVVGVSGLVTNVSALRRMERQLLQSQELFSTVFRGSPIAIALTTPDEGRILDVNPTCAQMLGYERDELIGHTSSELNLWESPAIRRELIEAVRRSGRLGGREHQVRRKGGEVIWAYASFFLTHVGGKEVLFSMWEDITARKRAEELLRRSEERFSKIFNASPLAIVVTSRPDERVIDLNAAFSQMSGYSRQAALGRTLAELQIFYKSGTALTAVLEDLSLSDHAANLELELRSRSGPSRIALGGVVATEISGESRLVSVWKDVTERRQWEARHRQVQKMEAIGSLAGGVAHDFNNILAVILGTTELLMSHKVPPQRADASLAQIHRAATRGARLTQQLLAFGRMQTATPALVNLNSRIEEVAEFLRRTLGSNIEFSFDLEPGLPPIRMDQVQFEQSVVNIALNARDAMKSGGKLSFRTHLLTSDDGSLQAELPPGRFVMLELRDTGEGMTPEVQTRIFDPFFTTKPQGQGTGLGLSTVYGIIRQSGGHVRVESQPGEGSTFRLFFPVFEETRAEEAASAHQL